LSGTEFFKKALPRKAKEGLPRTLRFFPALSPFREGPTQKFPGWESVAADLPRKGSRG
jgi:hypothetical protein